MRAPYWQCCRRDATDLASPTCRGNEQVLGPCDEAKGLRCRKCRPLQTLVASCHDAEGPLR